MKALRKNPKKSSHQLKKELRKLFQLKNKNHLKKNHLMKLLPQKRKLLKSQLKEKDLTLLKLPKKSLKKTLMMNLKKLWPSNQKRPLLKNQWKLKNLVKKKLNHKSNNNNNLLHNKVEKLNVLLKDYHSKLPIKMSDNGSKTMPVVVNQ